MKTVTLALLGLVAAVSAEDYEYFSAPRCVGNLVGSGTFACGINRVPASPTILSYNLRFANGIRAAFYDSRDCTGSAWFVDDGTGGCVTDSSARTNCINIPC